MPKVYYPSDSVDQVDLRDQDSDDSPGQLVYIELPVKGHC